MYETTHYDEMVVISLFLEGFLCGLYLGIFAIYLQYQTSKQDTNKTQNILFYSMCVLFILSASVFVCDITYRIFQFKSIESPVITGVQTMLFACCDFVSQFILIYRCWIVWGRNIRIVVIPSTLALAFLVIWIGTLLGKGSSSEDPIYFGLGYWMTLTGLALSLTVNALVTGLIVFKILKVFRQVRATSDDTTLAATGGSKLRRIILILIESAMVLFSIQSGRLVVSILKTDAALSLFSIVVVTHQMLNGITPTIIVVRTSMGLSFHDEKSMEEFAIESLRFASNHPNSVPEMGTIGIVGQNTMDDDRRSTDIDIVER